MSERIIKCAVADEFVRGAGVSVGAAGSHDNIILELRFSTLWDGLTKRALWLNALGEDATVTLLTADMAQDAVGRVYRVPVPANALKYAGNMSVTVRGVTVDADSGIETAAVVTEAAYFRVLESYFDAMEQDDIPADLGDKLQAEIDGIRSHITDARAAAKDAEAWAVGQIKGTDVVEDDPRHNNNAKFYAEAAEGAALGAEKQALDAEESAERAGAAAANAAESAGAAGDSATLAESYAHGGTGARTGEDTDNAKYWSEQAQQAAGGGVLSFKGRTGAVVPADGDYTAEQVGARPDTWTPSASDVGAIPAAQKGAAGGVATLDAEGKVPSDQLPKIGVDAYTKAETLSDTSAARFGLDSSAVPDDMWQRILQPQIIVTTKPGASVTAALDDTTVGPVMASEDGVATLMVPNYGEWAIVAEYEGETSAASFVDVDAVKQYQVKRQISALPSGYTELEYIGLTGTQYINTGLVPFNGITIYVKGLSIGGDDNAFYGSLGSGRTCLILNEKKYWYINGNDYYRRTPAPIKDTTYECIVQHFTDKAPSLTVNGESLTGGYIEPTKMDTSTPMFVGAGNTGGGVSWQFSGQINYFAAVNSSGETIQHLVPARRDSDDVVGMCDIVSGTFFTNAGSGSFTAGPEV